MDFQNSRIDYQRVMLEKFKFGISTHMERTEFMPEIEVDQMIDYACSGVIHRFRTEIYGHKLDHVKYPANWKEAVKERWFPKWLLKKYPVKYSKIEVKALYPQLVIPREQHQPYFHVAMMKWAEDEE